ncbi:G patch domain-containing protein 8-like isoform X1 [Dreissena polymorpha]|uniref:G patch domain-containing protein 8-like isoform X1 n=1 Tax=Dreissena polymorpha TaxID=45954 RepID=UPI0022656A4E|nr:G patch domain-containing protein 8-like isoform X1 [Dreissena polymorpha]
MVVRINTASEAELRAIPGVGQKTAKVIVRLREKYGTMTPKLLSLALGRTVPSHVLQLVEFPEAEQDFSLVVSDDLSEQFAEVEQFALSLPASVQVQSPGTAKLDVAARLKSTCAATKLEKGQQQVEQKPNLKNVDTLQPKKDDKPCKPLERQSGARFKKHETSDSEGHSPVRAEKWRKAKKSRTSGHLRRRHSHDSLSREDDDSDCDDRRSVRKHTRQSHAPSGGRSKRRNHSSDSSSRSGSRHGGKARRSHDSLSREDASSGSGNDCDDKRSLRKRDERQSKGKKYRTSGHVRYRRSHDSLSREDDDSDCDDRRPVRKHTRQSHAPSGGRSKRRNHSSDSSSRSGSRHSGKARRSHRHGHGRRRSRSSGSRFYYRSTSESGSLSEDDYHSRVHGDPKKMPKNLRYDGRTSWLSFKQKFDSYRKVYKWSDHECRDYLNWCLEGKALDYFTIETRMGESFSFRDIMRKMEGRFGSKELPENSRAKFQQATQQPGESLEDWADRVLTLATPAFRDLPDQFGQREAVSRFCQGCIDREAGKHACFERPRTIQHALDLVRHHQYVSQVVDGKKVRKYDQEVTVNAVQSPADVRMESLEKAIEQLTCKFEASLASNSSTSNKDRKFPQKTFRCFHCNGRGHMKRDCREYQESLKQKSGGQVVERSPQKPLNSKGPVA